RFRPTGKRRGLADAPRSLVFDFDDEPLAGVDSSVSGRERVRKGQREAFEIHRIPGSASPRANRIECAARSLPTCESAGFRISPSVWVSTVLAIRAAYGSVSKGASTPILWPVAQNTTGIA